MTHPVLPGAEPFAAPGGPDGVLVVHGFTGSPGSLRDLAHGFAAAGHAVELPLLPGHGTSVADMLTTRWEDWSAAAEAAYRDLASRCRRVVVSGLSMGGTLATWLAARHPEIAGLVVVNPMIDPPAESFLEALRGMLATGAETFPAIGSDIADPSVRELSYDETPIEPLLSLLGAVAELEPALGDVRCPVLIFTSRQDHVVPPRSSDVLAARVSGPVERVWLERSYHVATQDHDKEDIQRRAVEFVAKALATAGS